MAFFLVGWTFLAGVAFEGGGAALAFFFPLVDAGVGAVGVEVDMADVAERIWTTDPGAARRASIESKRLARAARAAERPSSVAEDILVVLGTVLVLIQRKGLREQV
jgi:hypothetical protein